MEMKKGLHMEKKVVLKEMEPKKRREYIWEYNKWYIIVGTFFAIFGTYLIVHYTTKKDIVANVIMVNTNVEAADNTGNELFDSFLEKNGYDTKHNEIVLNDGFYVNPNGVGQENYYSYQSVLTVLEAGGADVYFSDDGVYGLIQDIGLLKDLNEVLPKDVLDKYQDELLYTTDQETGETYPSAIQLSDNQWLKENQMYLDECVVGAAYGAADEKLQQKLMLEILGEN